MKRLLAYLLIFTSLLVITNVNAKSYGEGEVQLSKRTIENFISYIRGKGAKKPLSFYITLDGTGSTYWYCARSTCSSQNAGKEVKHCEKRFGKKCKLFAKGKFIKWKNSINPGKGKISRISNKWTDTEIFEKFEELGFYGDTSSTTTQTTEKKKKTTQTPITKVAKKNISKGNLDGFMNALEKAKNAGLTIDADTTAKQFGYKNFEEFFIHFKSENELSDLTIEEAKDFLLGSDNTIEIVESQENLDKLYDLVMNNKYFAKYQKKKNSYLNTFKKGKHKKNNFDQMALAVYMDYEKEMSKISKDPNLKKITRFAWDWGWSQGSAYTPFKWALEGCRKDAKKYKLSGGEGDLFICL